MFVNSFAEVKSSIIFLFDIDDIRLDAVRAMSVAHTLRLFVLCRPTAETVATVAARSASQLAVNGIADGDRERNTQSREQRYFPTAHCTASLPDLSRFLNFILPLFHITITVTAAATHAAQINTVHHHAPIVYTAELTM